MFDTIEKNGYVAKLLHDEFPHDPREDSEGFASTMVCDHPDYILGDTTIEELTGYKPSDFKDTDVLKRYITMKYKAVAFTWLGLLDHSGLHMYAGGGASRFDPGGWDSGTVGFAFVSHDSLMECYLEDTPVSRQRATESMHAEIEEYDSYLRGSVYEYIIEDPDGKIVDGCAGFYGYDYAEEEMKQALDNYVNSIAIQLPLLKENS